MDSYSTVGMLEHLALMGDSTVIPASVAFQGHWASVLVDNTGFLAAKLIHQVEFLVDMQVPQALQEHLVVV